MTIDGREYSKDEAVVILNQLMSDMGVTMFAGVAESLSKEQNLVWKLDGDEERMYPIDEVLEELEADTLSEDDTALIASLKEANSCGASDVLLMRGW